MTSAVTVEALTAKDRSLLSSTFQFFEHRQYKRGLKACEQLLKKHANLAEAIAMKGLFQSNLGKKDEGLELVRQGLKLNLKSHVCWHVYGLLHRADRNYEEALKCFRNALRFHPDNSQIMRDLAVLQTQMRQYSALCDTRYQLLVLRPALKMSWIGLAVAYHLDGRHHQAVGVIDALLEGFPLPDGGTGQPSDNTHTELVLYKTMILEESGSLQAALHALESPHLSPAPGSQVLQKKASLLLSLERFSESLNVYHALLQSNGDSKEALIGYVKCRLRLDPTLPALHVIKSLLDAHPKSLLLRSALLSLAGPDDLSALLEQHVLPMVRRGIPNSFNMVRHMYERKELLPSLASFINVLLEEIRAAPADCSSSCWLRLMVAQHFSLIGKHTEAIFHMEAAAKVESGCPEFFLYYAKILRRAGCLDKAADCMDSARRMDLSDRCLNSATVKYFLRAGRIDRAKELVTLFLKKNDMETQLNDLVEMQAIWFSYEMGLAFQQKGDHRKAVEYFGHILKDQYDFHNYALRSSNLRAYISLLRYEDVISGHRYFFKAAKPAVTSLLHLHGDVDAALESLSLDQSPKLDCLREAKKWVDRLLAFRAQDAESHVLAVRLFLAQSEQALAARSLVQARKLGGDSLSKFPPEAMTFIRDMVNESRPAAATPEAGAFCELWDAKWELSRWGGEESAVSPPGSLATPVLDSLLQNSE